MNFYTLLNIPLGILHLCYVLGIVYNSCPS